MDFLPINVCGRFTFRTRRPIHEHTITYRVRRTHEPSSGACGHQLQRVHWLHWPWNQPPRVCGPHRRPILVLGQLLRSVPHQLPPLVPSQDHTIGHPQHPRQTILLQLQLHAIRRGLTVWSRR